MKLYKMIEIYLKYDNMHTFRVINAFICINNHVNSSMNSMLSPFYDFLRYIYLLFCDLFDIDMNRHPRNRGGRQGHQNQ